MGLNYVDFQRQNLITKNNEENLIQREYMMMTLIIMYFLLKCDLDRCTL